MIELMSRSITAMFVYCGVLLYHWHAFNYVGPFKLLLPPSVYLVRKCMV